MMEMLVLNPTCTAQWQHLIEEAKRYSNILLTEELESYLVFLLMRHIEDTELTQKVLAIEFLESLQYAGKNRQLSLRDVGDKCLLFAGLFPNIARKRRVRISYYVNLGKSAYNSLSLTKENEFSSLYSKLCEHFVGLMDILQSMRHLRQHSAILDPIAAEELWADTQSRVALKTLQTISKASPLFPGFLPNSQQKH